MSTYLGQNFLIDSKVKKYIQDQVLKIKEKYNITNCMEIGPGKWAITKLIHPIFEDNFKVIEKDITMSDYLNFLDKKQIVRWDVLDYEISDIDKDSLIYGSLPYYITSPIIGNFFVENNCKYWLFITQKERAEKVQTLAHKKSYLRWLLNNNYDVELCKIIKPKSFNPPPKIDSAIVKLIYHGNNYINQKILQTTLDKISWYKRKTINKIFKIIEYETSKLDENIWKKRIEELSRDDMKIICSLLW